MEYRNVNFIYALVNSKNEIYDMSSDFDELEDERKSWNNMTDQFGDELPFRVEEIELGTKITF